MSRQFRSPKTSLRLGLDVPAVVSLLLALGVAAGPMVSSANRQVLSDQMSRTVTASSDITNTFYGSLAPAPLSDKRIRSAGITSLSTSNLELGTMDMSAFGDVE